MLKPTLDNVGRAAHPRSRGEHDQQDNAHYPLLGSSPLARGTSDSVLHCALYLRLIPARAGNMKSVTVQRCRWTAHPRSRGEHHTGTTILSRSQGSSPLARGTYIAKPFMPPSLRLIPARAGNISRWILKSLKPSAHPRSRGEHSTCFWSNVRCAGSSPLARGTYLSSHAHNLRLRLIPARAGNIQRGNTRVLPLAAHPRSRGEHAKAHS